MIATLIEFPRSFFRMDAMGPEKESYKEENFLRSFWERRW